jgi:hypothetical protein
MKTKKKLLSLSALIFVIGINCSWMKPVPVMSTALRMEQECKWQAQLCKSLFPPAQYREICLVDGDGNSCTCGDVTRECNKATEY